MDLCTTAAVWAGGHVRRWVLGRVRLAASRFRLTAPSERGGPPGKYGSKFEERTARVLERLLPRAKWVLHERPVWLTYPPTRRKLELDFWCPELNLAVEVDGIQHRVYVPPIHRTRAAFRAQQRRDRWKDAACIRRGVTLIRVPDTEALSDGDIERCLRTQLDRWAQGGQSSTP